MMAMRFLWVLLLLLMLSAGSSLGMDLGAAAVATNKSSASQVMVALNYSSIKIGPFRWRYFRGKLSSSLSLGTCQP